MSLRKLSFYAILVALLIFGPLEKLNHKSDLPDTSVDPPLLAARLRANQMPPADFLPVQSKNARTLRAGKVLVASRSLGDPLFAKTVILLVHYDAGGVLGLVLNRRTEIPISRALDAVKGAKDLSDPVYLGGPVETPAVFGLIQSRAKLEDAESIFDGIYLINSKPLFEQTISARPDPGVFHVYLGYAGWTQDQLQKEVELGAWFIFPGEARTVFNAHPDSLWQEMIRQTELQLAQTESGP